MRKFTTKKASRQNSVNYTLCEKLHIPCGLWFMVYFPSSIEYIEYTYIWLLMAQRRNCGARTLFIRVINPTYLQYPTACNTSAIKKLPLENEYLGKNDFQFESMPDIYDQNAAWHL